MIKDRKIKWKTHAVRMDKTGINRIIWFNNFMTSYRLEDVDVDVSEILKLILEE
jgi:hypothetical protein